MTMEDDDDKVVIIGAGICGLAMSLALHRKGIRSVVYEKSESLGNDTGAAIRVWQNGWRALDQLGVAGILRLNAPLIKRQRIISLDGQKQEETSINGEFRCLRNKDLINTLCAALPPNTVKLGYQLESIKLDLNTTTPVLRFTNGDSISAKAVIGCDGGKSVTAKFLNLKPTKMFSLCGVRGLTNYPNGHSFNHEFVRFKKGNILVGRIPINDNMVYWFCAQPYVPRDERIWKDPEAIRRSSLEFISDFPQEVIEMIKSADAKSLSFERLRYRSPWDLLTGTFYKGKVIVAGDAMHVMGTFMGQGGATGLEEAVVLARNMSQFGFNRAETGRRLMVHGVEEAFSLFVSERRMRVVQLSLQIYLTGMMLGASSRLKKVICIVLLSVLFSNTSGHTDYDCGNL